MMPSAKLLNSRIFKGLSLLLPLTLAGAIASPTYPQAGPPRTLSVRSDIQEADSKTGIVTARGNVQINYPARQIQATAAQAQYFSRERRIILSGDVYVLQQGNSLRGETITYLIDEGRFIAARQPRTGRICLSGCPGTRCGSSKCSWLPTSPSKSSARY